MATLTDATAAPALDINNKAEFLTAKTGWLDLIGLVLKCLVLYYLESAYAKEAERKALIAKQQNEIAQQNAAERQTNKPPDGSIII